MGDSASNGNTIAPEELQKAFGGLKRARRIQFTNGMI